MAVSSVVTFGLVTLLLFLCYGRSTDDIPISSATKDDRQIRANIAASFQVFTS